MKEAEVFSLGINNNEDEQRESMYTIEELCFLLSLFPFY